VECVPFVQYIYALAQVRPAYGRPKRLMDMPKRLSRANQDGSVRSLERGLALLELVNETGGVKPADAGRALNVAYDPPKRLRHPFK
jgi:hypothetical protein